MGGFGVERAQELSFQGVFRLTADAHELELAVPEDDFGQPNGLCLSPDESLLYVNDSERRLIRVYDVERDGTLREGRLFFDRFGGTPAQGGPDGMKCDELGNVWVTGPHGIWIISAAGEHVGVIRVPEMVGNLAWGGDNWDTLYLPSSTSLYRVQTRVASARLPYHR
jgi:gluconolactonase